MSMFTRKDKLVLLFAFMVAFSPLIYAAWAAVANRTQTNTVYVIDYINGTVQVESPLGVFGTVNTGHGVNELYSMNQDVESTDAVTFATVDTGQGANELYDMDQNVQTTDDVTFASVNATEYYFDHGLANATASGIIILGTVGEDTYFGQVLYFKSDGKYWKADCNATATMYAVAMCVDTKILANAAGTLLIQGYACNTNWSEWTIGSPTGPIYVSGTPGAFMQAVPDTAGDQVQRIGYAVAGYTVYVDFDSTVVEIG